MAPFTTESTIHLAMPMTAAAARTVLQEPYSVGLDDRLLEERGNQSTTATTLDVLV